METLIFFQQRPSGYGDGSGSGSGDGSGSGSGDGSGDGYGYGYGDGYGSGSGSGYGYSDGSGDGYGSGYGDGYGYSDGSGDGYGSGDGSGIKMLNGQNLEYIDGVPTILTSIKGDLAKGFIVELADFSKSECFVARSGYTYAHGKTAREATKALEDKLIAEMSVEDRLQEFSALKLSPSKRYPVKLFYDWHGRLTGSCESGRAAFAKSHGIDVEHGTMTLGEFLKLVQNAYGADVIKQISMKSK